MHTRHARTNTCVLPSTHPTPAALQVYPNDARSNLEAKTVGTITQRLDLANALVAKHAWRVLQPPVRAFDHIEVRRIDRDDQDLRKRARGGKWRHQSSSKKKKTLFCHK